MATGAVTPPQPREPAPLLVQTKAAGLEAMMCCALEVRRGWLQIATCPMSPFFPPRSRM